MSCLSGIAELYLGAETYCFMAVGEDFQQRKDYSIRTLSDISESWDYRNSTTPYNFDN